MVDGSVLTVRRLAFWVTSIRWYLWLQQKSDFLFILHVEIKFISSEKLSMVAIGLGSLSLIQKLIVCQSCFDVCKTETMQVIWTHKKSIMVDAAILYLCKLHSGPHVKRLLSSCYSIWSFTQIALKVHK